MPIFYSLDESPIGALLLCSDGASLTGVYFDGATALARLQSARSSPRAKPQADRPELVENDAHLAPVHEQLHAYFAGERIAFELPLLPAGTDFQRRVWRALCDIPYGETVSYGELAQQIGHAQAVRAVGAANGRNPIPIVIPCHRVIGADGQLTGFGGGLPRKRHLLALEARTLEARGRLLSLSPG